MSFGRDPRPLPAPRGGMVLYGGDGTACTLSTVHQILWPTSGGRLGNDAGQIRTQGHPRWWRASPVVAGSHEVTDFRSSSSVVPRSRPARPRSTSTATRISVFSVIRS